MKNLKSCCFPKAHSRSKPLRAKMADDDDDDDSSSEEDIAFGTRENVFSDINSIYVKTFSEKIISLEVKSSDTIGDVKVKIRAKEGIPVDQQALIFNKMVLEDTNTIADFDIKNYSTLKLMRKSKGLMQIFVKIPKMMTTTSLEAKPSDTIGDVKAKIWDKVGIPIEEQALTFNKMVLEDSGTLVDFDIKKDSTLKLMFKSRGLFTIFVKDLITSRTNEFISVMVKPTDTISNVKDKIKTLVRIPCNKQVLILNEKVLEDSGTLADFNIDLGFTLTLMRTTSGFIQVFIKRLDGKTFALEVKRLDTVENLKAKIREKEGFPSCNQIIFFNGETGRTLADYNVTDESILEFMLRLRGS